MLSTMWGFGSKDTENSHEHRDKYSASSATSPSKSQKSKLPSRGGRNGRNGQIPSPLSVNSSIASSKQSTSLSFAFSDETLSVSETMHGVEVALDWTAATAPQVAVVNFSHHVRQANKMHKCQFSMNYPVLPRVATSKRPQFHQQQRHRVPLVASKPTSTLQDQIFLLQSHNDTDEITSVKRESERLDAEIQALEEDRMELEHDYLRLPSEQQSSDAPLWDLEYMLQHQKPSLENVEELQRLRGRCWTLQLQMKSRDALCSTLGTAPTSPSKRTNKYKSRTTLTAATQVSHLTLLPSHPSHAASFFLHNTDAAESHGHVPPRLLSRMKKQALPVNMLQYLTTGPNGSYFCSFTSGHNWWGMADPDFRAIVKDWPVHRVAFGEAKKLAKQKRLYSWIVVSRDGRVAFKNLPLRLTHLLGSRLADEPAPSEISLGPEGTYFIRFLNGTIDYCLPAHVTEVCNFIETRGGKITNVFLHPQLSKEFIVRHTELR